MRDRERQKMSRDRSYLIREECVTATVVLRGGTWGK